MHSVTGAFWLPLILFFAVVSLLPGHCIAQLTDPEVYALRDLYQSTTGARWKTITGWTQLFLPLVNDKCAVYGITCSNGKVIRISLPDNNLVGSIPPSFAVLTSLEELDLSGNGQLDNFIVLQHISSLRKLNLASVNWSAYSRDTRDGNSTIGTLISGLPNLVELDISNNVLRESIPDNIDSLQHLEVFKASRAGFISTLPVALTRLSKLRQLMLDNNVLEGHLPTSIGNFTQLQHLRLDSNSFYGPLPASLSNLKALTFLNISNNALSGPLPDSLRQLTNLRHFLISDNAFVDTLSVVEDMQSLVSINAANNYFRGNPISHLKAHRNLTSIQISGNLCSGNLTALTSSLGTGGFPALEEILLNNNNFSGSLPPALNMLPTVKIFSISNNRLSGTLPPPIFQMQNLQQLDLSNNMLTGSLPPTIGLATRLQLLNLRQNQLTGSIPPSLRQATALQLIDLSENSLTGGIPDLSPLSGLQYLSLSRNKLSGAPLQSLLNLSQLVLLNMSMNTMTGSLDEFAPLTELVLLDVGYNSFHGNLSMLSGLRKLKVLSLPSNYISGSIEYVALLSTELQVLHVGNNQISGWISESVFLSELMLFNASHNSISGSISADWIQPKLLQLYLQNNHIAEFRGVGGGRTVSKVFMLTEIDLSQNQVGYFDGSALTMLKTLNLSNNMLLTQWSVPALLSSLDLSGNQMVTFMAAQISSMTSVTTLKLSSNVNLKLTAEQLASILALPSLESINLSHTNLTAVNLTNLAMSTKSAVLEFRASNTGLYGQIADIFKALPSLEILDVSYNSLGGEIPEAQMLYSNFYYFDISHNLMTGKPPKILSSVLRYYDISSNHFYGSPPEILSQSLQKANMSNNLLSDMIPDYLAQSMISTIITKLGTVTIDADGNTHVEKKVITGNSSLAVFDLRGNSGVRWVYPFTRMDDSDVQTLCAGETRTDMNSVCLMDGITMQMPYPDWVKFCCAGVKEESTYRDLFIAGATVISLGTIIPICVKIVKKLRRRAQKRRQRTQYLNEVKTKFADVLEGIDQNLIVPFSDIKPVKKLGEGAYGIVYRGLWNGETVALKSFKSLSEQAMRDVIREVQILAKMRNRNVVMLLAIAIDIQRDKLGLVLEYMERGSLSDVLSVPDPSSWSTKLDYMLQIAQGMHYLHNADVLHRDLKGANVLVDDKDRAKITDFGLSRSNNEHNAMTAMIGTVAYMAPELFNDPSTRSSGGSGSGSNSNTSKDNSRTKLKKSNNNNSNNSNASDAPVYGKEVDVYSYGMLLFEIIAQKAPWSADSTASIIMRVTQGEIPDPNNEIDSPLADPTENEQQIRVIELMRACCSMNPSERPSFLEIVEQIDKIRAIKVAPGSSLLPPSSNSSGSPLTVITVAGDSSAVAL